MKRKWVLFKPTRRPPPKPLGIVGGVPQDPFVFKVQADDPEWNEDWECWEVGYVTTDRRIPVHFREWRATWNGHGWTPNDC